MSAVISDCGKYRYSLSRNLAGGDGNTCLFIMLNPSTADATVDDRTIGRCKEFAKREGSSELVVANLYAFRATDPSELWACDDPVGIENDEYLSKLLKEHRSAICGWGTNAKSDRVHEFLRLLWPTGADLYCLGTTKHGAPKHPLYLRGDTPLIRYEP